MLGPINILIHYFYTATPSFILSCHYNVQWVLIILFLLGRHLIPSYTNKSSYNWFRYAIFFEETCLSIFSLHPFVTCDSESHHVSILVLKYHNTANINLDKTNDTPINVVIMYISVLMLAWPVLKLNVKELILIMYTNWYQREHGQYKYCYAISYIGTVTNNSMAA